MRLSVEIQEPTKCTELYFSYVRNVVGYYYTELLERSALITKNTASQWLDLALKGPGLVCDPCGWYSGGGGGDGGGGGGGGGGGDWDRGDG
jgi:hypothetical protein